MLSTLILRDIPKESVQIDLWHYPIQGGFRGFQMVPEGIHYISIVAGNRRPCFWLSLPPNEVSVKVFDSTQLQFVDDDAQSAEQYRDLALSGAMAKSLLRYPHEQGMDWWNLTRHINMGDSLPQLHQETSIAMPLDLSPTDLAEWMVNHHQSRFEMALSDSHQGDKSAFLAEFQFAFVRWLVTAGGQEDLEAFSRWQHLLLGIYNAGEGAIAQYPDLFCHVSDSLLTQFRYLPDFLLTPDSFVIENAPYLAEDMMDTELPELVKKGQELSAWLEGVLA
jgi:hypothetical protein